MNPRVIQNISPILSNSTLVLVLLCTVGVYMYLVSMSVVHVVVQKETIRNNKLVLSEIANLEAEYISAQHVVSERIAKQSDLTEQSDKIFVSRSAPSLVMSPRDGG